MKQRLKSALRRCPRLYDVMWRLHRRLVDACYYVLPTRYVIHRQWRARFGTRLDLEHPRTFNEKLQWLRAYADSPLARRCADKLAVRDYVRECIGEAYLARLLATGQRLRDIDFGRLPRAFVVKATHDSGSVLVVTDSRHIDPVRRALLEYRLTLNFGRRLKEWVYDRIPPRVLVEEYLGGPQGEAPDDFKVFCFNGRARVIQLHKDRFTNHAQRFYDTDWQALDLRINDRYPALQGDVERPACLALMLRLSERLAAPFNHVRVDWYVVQGRLVFGEMTFIHGGGLERVSPPEWDATLGSWFEISKDLSHPGSPAAS